MKLYVDSSALVKLLIDEPASEEAVTLASAATRLIAASIGYVEARAALAAALRSRRLDGARRDFAVGELDRVWGAVDVVQLDDRLVALAGEAADAFGLRAADAIHLASALVVDEPELLFATWDSELARAAGEAGLAVAP